MSIRIIDHIEPQGEYDPIMPLGKYKGMRCSQIDDVRYLDWLVDQTWLKEPFATYLLKHLETRQDWIQLGEEQDTDAIDSFPDDKDWESR